MAGRAATVLVGTVLSIVIRACLVGSIPWLGSSSLTRSVAIGVLPSNTILATLRICVPVARPALGEITKLTYPSPRPVPFSGGRKPVSTLGRKLSAGIDRLERDRQLPGLVVEAGVDDDVERHAVVGHRDRGLIILAARRNRQDGVAEADLGQLEGTQVEVGVERVGDHDLLSGGGGRGGVLEVDLVGEERQGRARDEVSGP